MQNNLFAKEQHGLLPLRSCTTQFLMATEMWNCDFTHCKNRGVKSHPHRGVGKYLLLLGCFVSPNGVKLHPLLYKCVITHL